MGNTESKVKVSKPSPQDQAILDVVFARDNAKRYLDQVTQKWANEQDNARQFMANNKKDDARRALRRRKYLQDIINKTKDQHEQLEYLAQSIRGAEIQKGTLKALESGKNALQAINKEMGGLKRAEEIMEQSANAIADTEEISNVLAGGLEVPDEDAIDDELEVMERESAEAKRLDAISKGEPLPNAPRTEPQAQEGEKESEERQEDRQMLAA